jgi:hypothetical protein
MSNFLAIATVTAALGETIRPAVERDVSGATVNMARPDGVGGHAPTIGVNLYLYQVTPNAAWRNADLPTRRPDGQLVRRPQAALDLHYLLSFYGNETQLEPQRLLGSVVRALNARPVLTRKMIQETLANPAYDYLGKSNLGEAIELVKFTPLPLSLEELSKLWSVFFQTPYTLSVAYQGTVVLIESDETPQAALPVRERDLYVMPFGQPEIERVESQAGADQPIFADSTLVISGKQLRGGDTKLRVLGYKETPPQDVSDTQIVLPLGKKYGSPSEPAILLRAGVHGIQVLHMIRMGSPPELHPGVESNVAAFVLRPTIKKDATTGGYQIEISEKQTNSDGTHAAKVKVTLEPGVGKKQRVVLLLNEFDPPSGRPPRAYSFEAKSADQPAPPQDSPEKVTFSVSGIRAGTYLVRVQVDGAESPLETDSTGKYNSPQVTIP